MASNQVVGSSNLSGRAIISMSYGALKNYKFPKNKNNKVVIGSRGTTVGSVVKSGWFAYRPTILDIFPQRINTDEAWKTP